MPDLIGLLAEADPLGLPSASTESNRHSSTLVAFSAKRAKLTPRRPRLRRADRVVQATRASVSSLKSHANGRQQVGGSHLTPKPCQSAVFAQQRSTSATLQAWATQPRGVNGASASKISLIEPTQASLRWSTKPSRKRRAACAVVRMDAEPGVDERPDQPGPDRSLVIGGVAGPQVAEVLRLVIGMARRQRPQADRRQQSSRATVSSTGCQRSRPAPDGRSEMAKI